MSDYIPPPTLEQLVLELKDLDADWVVFGVLLGVPLSKLRAIESTNKDVERCKLEALQYWLNNKIDASWKKIVQALEGIEQCVLAAKVKKKYLWPSAGGEREDAVTADSQVTTAGNKQPSIADSILPTAVTFSDDGLKAHYLQLLAEKDQQLQAAADKIALLESRLTVQQVSTSSDHYQEGSHTLNAVRPSSVNTSLQANTLAVAPASAHEEIATGGQTRGAGESGQCWQQTLMNPTPTLLELKTMLGEDGTPLNIIEKVAAGDYMTFGMCLLQDKNGDEIEIIENDHRHKGAKAVTQAIIRKWLKSGGRTCTYEHLIGCLKQSGLYAIAGDIYENY